MIGSVSKKYRKAGKPPGYYFHPLWYSNRSIVALFGETTNEKGCKSLQLDNFVTPYAMQMSWSGQIAKLSRHDFRPTMAKDVSSILPFLATTNGFLGADLKEIMYKKLNIERRGYEERKSGRFSAFPSDGTPPEEVSSQSPEKATISSRNDQL